MHMHIHRKDVTLHACLLTYDTVFVSVANWQQTVHVYFPSISWLTDLRHYLRARHRFGVGLGLRSHLSLVASNGKSVGGRW